MIESNKCLLILNLLILKFYGCKKKMFVLYVLKLFIKRDKVI